MTSVLRKRVQYLLSVLSILLAGALMVVAWGWWQMRRSLPQLEGSRSVAGLSASVKIERDSLGVPTITGETRLDVARATGFVHAQDRFFQMDLLRRRAAGELAELFGKDAVSLDQSARIHQFRSLAAKVVDRSTHAQRELLKAYTEGVNAGLAALPQRPWEYFFLRLAPHAWREEDSILCIYAMWFDLQDYDGSFELNNDALRRSLNQAAAEFLAPRGTSWDAAMDGSTFDPAPMPRMRFRGRTETPSASLAPLREEEPTHRVIGSNAFGVSGAHTATGAAMVANDMHLDFSVPHIWYRSSLVWKDGATTRRVTGVSLPGTPLITVGSNGHVAWGFTNSYIDASDLVVTELDPTAQIFYRAASGWLRVDERTEEIKVKGEAAIPLPVRWTEWGPIIGKASDGRWHTLRWSAHDVESTNLDLMDLETAETTEAAIAISHRAGIPPENIVIADRQGTVAWTIAGRVPRRVGYDGRIPVIWAYGDRRWDGWLKPEEIPVVTSNSARAGGLAAPDGLVWSGNNRSLGGDAYQKLGDSGYSAGQRGRQIRDDLRELVRADKKATPADLYAVQLDDRAVFLERWQKFLLELLSDDAVARNRKRGELRDLVRTWDGRASVDSVSYRVVRAFRGHVAERVFSPFVDLAKPYYLQFNYRALPYEDALWKLVTDQPLELLSPANQSWESLLLAAVDDVFEDAEKANVPLKRFTWGSRNTLRMTHPFGRMLPDTFASFLSMPADQLPGDADMPRVQGQRYGQSQRMVVSPGHEAEGIMNMPGGQSGHPLSPYFRAGHEAWVKGEASPFLPGPAQHTLTLTP